MPRPKGKVPSYSHHKASGRAVVRLDGKDHYLGVYGSPESQERYEQLITEWRLNHTVRAKPAATPSPSDRLTIAEVLFHYREFARNYYVKDGKPSKEFDNMRYALRPLRKLFGASAARDFGPKALKAVRQHLVDSGLSRGATNSYVNRIKRFFKWAVSEELIPPMVYEGLRSVLGLSFGRSTAREAEPVKPVLDCWVDATLPFLSRPTAAMVELQRSTGMRPCEVVQLRACDVDMSGKVWIYEPLDHKNRWRGHKRLIPLGPRAQAILKPFFTLKTEAFLFSPKQAEEERNDARRKKRLTPMTPSQASRRPKVAPKRAKRDRYDVSSYRRAIKYAIKKANRLRPKEEAIPSWSPLQLRHNRATQIRKTFGLEAAQVSLGHAHANVTEIYAERNLDLAVEIAEKTG